MPDHPGALFLCPQCRSPLPAIPPCSCGFVLRESKGILNLMTDEEAASAAPFIEAYEVVRSDEQWGGDDLDLPFHPKRHREIWDIRQRTFRCLASVVRNIQRGVALDVGAGSCWLTRHLDAWGFDSIAIDFNDSAGDGLRAGQKFIDEGAKFLRVRSGMESLPIVSSRTTLLVTSAAFHYATDFRGTLSEFDRVLAPGGTIVIMDTPVYENDADGKHMIATREEEFRRKYGIPGPFARRARYLVRRDFESTVDSLHLRLSAHPVWPGLRRTYESFRARLRGQRIAEFPVLVIEKR